MKRGREVPDVAVEAERAAVVKRPEVEPVNEARESVERRDTGADLRAAEKVKTRLVRSEPVIDEQKRAAIVAEYVRKNVPKHLQRTTVFEAAHQKISALVMGVLNVFGQMKLRGAERVPQEGGFVMVSNHTRFFDESKLLALIGRPAHIVAADMHANTSFFHKWFMKAIGTLEVDSTLNNLTEEEKTALMVRVPKGARAYYQKVIDRDREKASLKAGRKQMAFLQSTVALLIKGEPVILFPEGLWLYEGKMMRKAYGGIEFIAKEYKRVTGKDLPIVPVGISEGKATAGEVVAMTADGSVHDVMRKVAALLPEEERGYYGQDSAV
jgi:1-acyl-sn-glycerol-3-phosphate acyltransferase